MAYRTTFAGAYRLRPTLLRDIVGTRSKAKDRPRKGLGRNASYNAIAKLRELGYLQHYGPKSAPKERHTVQAGDRTPHVKRCWFDGTLSLNALATLIWLQVNPGCFTRELAERFGWSRTTAQAALAELKENGWLVEIVQKRDADGRFSDKRYRAQSQSGRDQITGNQLTGNRFSGCIHRDTPQRTLQSRDPSAAFQKDNGETSPRPQDMASTNPCMVSLSAKAFEDKKLLGWLDDDDQSSSFGQWIGERVTDSHMRQLEDAWPDEALREALREATGRRVAKEILQPQGLYAVRLLAAHVASTSDLEPVDSMARILEIIAQRIGETDDWLHSLKLVGSHLAKADRENLEHYPFKLEALQVMGSLRNADVNCILAPRLFDEGEPDFLRLYNTYGADALLDVVQDVIGRSIIDGADEGQITSWFYFAEPLKEEQLRQEMADRGLTIGDTLGAHREWLRQDRDPDD